MAKVLKNGLLSGRVGNLVYFVINGKQYVRAWAKPADPKTPGQRRQRAKICACARFLSPLKGVINIGYQGCSRDLEQFNEATRYHLENAMEEITEPGSVEFAFRVIPEKVRLSRGLIPPPLLLSCERNGREVSVSWNPDIGKQINQKSDALVVVAWEPGRKPFADLHTATRGMCSAVILLPQEFGSQVHLWVFYFNVLKSGFLEKRNVSDSVYIGVI